ncbi:MAG: carbon-nitrogen hydrolase family protein [Myxococcota bacterium]|nr:carbon-nitrogen hydrolase family protein [Myxococcota bacterium]
MKVAAVQFRATPGDNGDSLRRLIELADEAAMGQDLLVLPEMAVTGYGFERREDVLEVAETPDGPTGQALSRVAARHGCWVVCGFPELDGDRLFNSAMVLDGRGETQFVYQKMCLFEADYVWASPGERGYRTFETPSGAFTVGICMDLNDDNLLRWIIEESPRALAFPTNWVDEGSDVWPYWAWRLQGTGTALVAANSYGLHGKIPLRGRSAILDDDTLLAGGPPTGDGILRATLP